MKGSETGPCPGCLVQLGLDVEEPSRWRAGWPLLIAASALLLGAWALWPRTLESEPPLDNSDEQALLDAFRQEAGIELDAMDPHADEEAQLTREIVRQGNQ